MGVGGSPLRNLWEDLRGGTLGGLGSTPTKGNRTCDSGYKNPAEYVHLVEPRGGGDASGQAGVPVEATPGGPADLPPPHRPPSPHSRPRSPLASPHRRARLAHLRETREIPPGAEPGPAPVLQGREPRPMFHVMGPRPASCAAFAAQCSLPPRESIEVPTCAQHLPRMARPVRGSDADVRAGTAPTCHRSTRPSRSDGTSTPWTSRPPGRVGGHGHLKPPAII